MVRHPSIRPAAMLIASSAQVRFVLLLCDLVKAASEPLNSLEGISKLDFAS